MSEEQLHEPYVGAVLEQVDVERFIRTMKDECFRLIRVPMRLAETRTETGLFVGWYNRHRPSQSLRCRTPEEVWLDQEPASEEPRWEPRPKWPRASLPRSARPFGCAAPQAPVKGRRGGRTDLEVAYVEGRRHLPVLRLRRSA